MARPTYHTVFMPHHLEDCLVLPCHVLICNCCMLPDPWRALMPSNHQDLIAPRVGTNIFPVFSFVCTCAISILGVGYRKPNVPSKLRKAEIRWPTRSARQKTNQGNLRLKYVYIVQTNLLREETLPTYRPDIIWIEKENKQTEYMCFLHPPSNPVAKAIWLCPCWWTKRGLRQQVYHVCHIFTLCDNKPTSTHLCWHDIVEQMVLDRAYIREPTLLKRSHFSFVVRISWAHVNLTIQEGGAGG